MKISEVIIIINKQKYKLMKKIYLIFPILAGIMFGSGGIFVRTLTENGIDSTTLLFLRYAIALPVILIFILVNDKTLLKPKFTHLNLFIITGLSIVALNLCYNVAVIRVSLSLAAILLSSAPVFVIIFAYIFFREKITSQKVISIILVIVGCTLTTGLLEGNIANVSMTGILWGAGSAVFWAIYTLASKKALEVGEHTYTILFYSLILIVIVLLPFTSFSQITAFINMDIIINTIFLILHSLLTFAIPYILLTESLNYVDSGISSILTSGAEPLAALVWGIIIYDEIPSLLMLVGIILTISALAILSKSES